MSSRAAGQNSANAYAMIMSGKMLLDWLGRKRNDAKATAAARINDDAMERGIAGGKHLNGDLGGKASTTDMGDAVVLAVK